MTTKAQRAAVIDVLMRLDDYTDFNDLVDDVIQAAIVGDTGTRYCVVTQDPGLEPIIHGPYATAETARRRMYSGGLATLPGAKGRIYPISTGPRVRRK